MHCRALPSRDPPDSTKTGSGSTKYCDAGARFGLGGGSIPGRCGVVSGSTSGMDSGCGCMLESVRGRLGADPRSPEFTRCRPSLACCQSLAKNGKVSTKLCQCGPNLGRCWPNWPTICQPRAILGQCWPVSTKVGQQLAKYRLPWQRLDNCCETVGQHRTTPGSEPDVYVLSGTCAARRFRSVVFLLGWCFFSQADTLSCNWASPFGRRRGPPPKQRAQPHCKMCLTNRSMSETT